MSESSGDDAPGPLPDISRPPAQKARTMSCEPASEVTYFMADDGDPMEWSIENQPKNTAPHFRGATNGFGLKFPIAPTRKGSGAGGAGNAQQVSDEGPSAASPYRTMVLTKKNLALFSALCEMQFLVLNDETTYRIFPHMLASLLTIMKCDFGWIGEVLEEEDENTGETLRYAKTFAVSNIAWDEEQESVYNSKFLHGFKFRKYDSLYGHTLRTGKVKMTNDPDNDPLHHGTPPGHPPIRNFLSFPFFCKGKFVGMAAIANCIRDFVEEDVRFLQPFVHSCAYAIGWLKDKQESQLIRQNEKLQCIKLIHESELNINLSAKLVQEKNKTMELLSNIIPTRLMDRVIDDPGEIVARTHPNVTVLFADLYNFTTLLSNHSPQTVLLMLNDVFGEFGDIAGEFDIEKIKTVGDCFMAVGGLAPDDYCHQVRMCLMAVKMNKKLNEKSTKMLYGETIQARFGIATGSIASGVIGRGRLAYDCWGEAVNVASRMEALSEPGRIRVSADLKESVGGLFDFEDAGMVDVKGKGKVASMFLTGPKERTIMPKAHSTCNPETHSCVNVERHGYLTSSAHGYKSVQPDNATVPLDDANWMTNFIEGAIPVWEYSSIQQHVMITSMFRYLDLLDKFKIDVGKFDNFVTSVFKCYNDNPYHNCEHAIDITHTTFLFLRDPALLSCLWDHSVLALMLASLCHDLNHPGQNNNYQRKACTPLIFAYSSTSYLEEMHVVETFRLLSHSSSNILYNMPADERAAVLKMVKSMILATDFASTHMNHMKMFEGIVPELKEVISGKVKLKDSPLGSEENQQILLNMLLKASDVSNLVKPFPIAKEWAWRVSAEFFKQGDMEREAGLTVDPGFDRHSAKDVNVALGQFNFNRFLHSMWQKLADAIPQFSIYVEISESNAKEWKRLADENAEITSPLAANRQFSRDSTGSAGHSGGGAPVGSSRKMSTLLDLKESIERSLTSSPAMSDGSLRQLSRDSMGDKEGRNIPRLVVAEPSSQDVIRDSNSPVCDNGDRQIPMTRPFSK